MTYHRCDICGNELEQRGIARPRDGQRIEARLVNEHGAGQHHDYHICEACASTLQIDNDPPERERLLRMLELLIAGMIEDDVAEHERVHHT